MSENKKSMFSGIAGFYKRLDTRGRGYVWTGLAGICAGIIFFIFEPFSPYHAPLVFLFAGAGLGFLLGGRRLLLGGPVLLGLAVAASLFLGLGGVLIAL